MRQIYAKPFRLIASLLVMLSWMVATNHCALGLMAVADGGENHLGVHRSGVGDQDEDADNCPDDPGHHGECPGHDHSKGSGSPGACCQSILAPALVTTKLVSYDSSRVALQAFILTVFKLAASLQPRLAPLEIDTGPPPGSISFAESVLQRSILAHAPPLLA